MTKSSGTNGAGTDTTLPELEAPMITPVARLVEPVGKLILFLLSFI